MSWLRFITRLLSSPLAAVTLGGGLGSCLRFAVEQLFSDSGLLPLGTLAANLAGSLMIGVFAGLSAEDGPLNGRARLQAFLIGGLCGGFTTFSLLALEVALFFAERTPLAAAGYLAGTLAGSLLAARLGLRLATGPIDCAKS